ncbi:MAG: carbohydrate binding domain-containing protein [Clostridia bacterium]|nr:carbohydrate binding domain-containing protein [Clostridia bacterium]
MKRLLYAALALLCVVTLAVTAVAPVAAVSGTDLPWTSKDLLIEKILKRDGLIDGIWFPWFEGGSIGHGLTGNDVMAKYYGSSWSKVSMDAVGADKIYREIYNLKAMGYNILGFGGSVYDEGVIHDAYGDVIGIKQDYLDNARRLLNMCREIGMPVMWTVCFHSSSAPDYYGMDAYNIFSQKYARKDVADHYAERFVRPLCKMLAEYKDVVALVAIADEPENEINDSAVGDHFGGGRAWYGVNRENMVYFMSRINSVVKSVLPDVARTVASNNQNKSIYEGFNLDLMGHNVYHNNVNIPEVEDYKSDAPVILTEYNVGHDLDRDPALFTRRLIEYRQKMIQYGYKGGIQWCWLSGGTHASTAYYLLHSYRRNAPNTDFLSTVTDLRHHMDEYRAKHQGKTITLDAPVLYCNEGGGYVEWIPSQRGVKMDLLRSTDGGKSWVKILDNVNQSDYVTEHKKGVYKDTATANSQYKIVVRDGKGNSAESAPNNVAGVEAKYKKAATQITPAGPLGIGKDSSKSGAYTLYSFGEINNRPANASANLIANGSFETQSGPWTAMLGGTVSVVSDSTAPNGSKSLLFNASSTTEQWAKFTVKVQPNTDYVFSAWVKGGYLSASNAGHASIGVVDPTTGKFMIYSEKRGRASRANRQIYPTAWDNQWHLRSVAFNSGDLSEISIALCGDGTKLWVDDIALFKNGDGVKYTSTNITANMRVDFYSDEYTCADTKCLNKNTAVNSADYWKNGLGWRGGFLSVVDGGKSGKALKYKASANTYGTYYIQWIDVTPHTEYVFYMDAKILQSGDGRVALLNSRLTLPEDVVFMALDKEVYGSDWFKFYVTFNSSAFTRVGIAVCDMGGEALLDNIRLFKKADGTLVEKNDGHNTAGTTAPGQKPGTTVPGQKPGTTTVPGGTDATQPTNPDGTPSEGDGDADNGAADSQDKGNKKDQNNKKDQPASLMDFLGNLSGPVLLAISFGGMVLLIGLGVGVYFLIRAIGKKKKTAPPAAPAAAEAPTEDTAE